MVGTPGIMLNWPASVFLVRLSMRVVISPALLKYTRVSGRFGCGCFPGFDTVDVVLDLEAERWCSLNLSSCVSCAKYSEVLLMRGNVVDSSPS